MAQYSTAEYWDERYEADQRPFDWYQRWAGIKDVIKPYLEERQRILVVGCGTSRLSEELYDDGLKNVVSMDISSVGIRVMTEKFAATPKADLIWKVMDVLDMSEFEDNSFDIAVDKATMDSLLCGQQATQQVPKALSEISRVLRDGGIFFAVSYGQPQYRLNYLERPELGWKVEVKSVPKPTIPLLASTAGNEKENVHYVYVCTKTAVVPTAADLAEKLATSPQEEQEANGIAEQEQQPVPFEAETPN